MSRVRLPGKSNARVAAFPDQAVSITAESDALAIATVANWLSVEGWRTTLGVKQPDLEAADEQYFVAYPQFEIEFDCDAAETITSVQIYGCRLAPVTIADDTFTASGTDEVCTAASHGMLTGDGPFQLTTSGTLPAEFSLLTNYWVEKTGASTFELYTSRALAVAAGGGIATTDAGTGTHTIADVQGSANKDDDTRRFRQTLVGDINEAAAVVMTSTTSYMERINHSPLNLYYVILGTVGAAQTVTITITPVAAIER